MSNAHIEARPYALDWDVSETALIVVDMQNGFLKPGGYFDKVGYDLSHSPRTIAMVARSVEAARKAGMQVVFIQSGWDARHLWVGGPDAPMYHKSEAQILMRKHPEIGKTLITEGNWDYEIVDELKPREDELVVRKSRYSGFAGTNLDQVLRARRVRNLAFTGVATNACVETTLREAFHREYFVMLLEDATHHAGPQYLKDATVWNILTFFGWVTTTEAFEQALAPARVAAAA